MPPTPRLPDGHAPGGTGAGGAVQTHSHSRSQSHHHSQSRSRSKDKDRSNNRLSLRHIPIGVPSLPIPLPFAKGAGGPSKQSRDRGRDSYSSIRTSFSGSTNTNTNTNTVGTGTRSVVIGLAQVIQAERERLGRRVRREAWSGYTSLSDVDHGGVPAGVGGEEEQGRVDAVKLGLGSSSDKNGDVESRGIEIISLSRPLPSSVRPVRRNVDSGASAGANNEKEKQESKDGKVGGDNAPPPVPPKPTKPTKALMTQSAPTSTVRPVKGRSGIHLAVSREMGGALTSATAPTSASGLGSGSGSFGAGISVRSVISPPSCIVIDESVSGGRASRFHQYSHQRDSGGAELDGADGEGKVRFTRPSVALANPRGSTVGVGVGAGVGSGSAWRSGWNSPDDDDDDVQPGIDAEKNRSLHRRRDHDVEGGGGGGTGREDQDLRTISCLVRWVIEWTRRNRGLTAVGVLLFVALIVGIAVGVTA